MVVTSDAHVSLPEGRWPDATFQYQAFLESLNPAPEIVFNVGDFVDNAYMTVEGIQAGDLDYWTREIEIYNVLNAALPSTKFMHTFGVGHDFVREVTLQRAEQVTGVARRGVYKWGLVDLIWLTPTTGVFNDTGANHMAFTQDDYTRLDETLAGSQNAILLWHVPLRTPQTQAAGIWPGGRNLTIPHGDDIYPLLEKHKSQISVVFNGHIHKAIKTEVSGILMYLCPLFDNGCYCEVKQLFSTLSVIPKGCGIEPSYVKLNNGTYFLIPIYQLLFLGRDNLSLHFLKGYFLFLSTCRK